MDSAKCIIKMDLFSLENSKKELPMALVSTSSQMDHIMKEA